MNGCACFGGTGGGTADADRRGESPIDAVLVGLAVTVPDVVESTPCAFLSVPKHVELDAPVLPGARGVCEPLAQPPPPPPFNAVPDAALAELGRAQLPTDAIEVLPSTCVSAADRRLVDGLEGRGQRSDIR